MSDTPTNRPPPDGKMALALSEISHVFQALSIIEGPLPLEAERILSYYFAQFHDVGAEAAQRTTIGLRAELEEKRQMCQKLLLENRDLRLQIIALKEKLREGAE